MTGPRLRQRVARAEVDVKCPTCGQSTFRIRRRLEEMRDHIRATLTEKEAAAMIESFRRIWLA